VSKRKAKPQAVNCRVCGRRVKYSLDYFLNLGFPLEAVNCWKCDRWWYSFLVKRGRRELFGFCAGVVNNV